MSHFFDQATDFCIHCGIARYEYDTHGYRCDEFGNVTGISHLIALRKLKLVVNNDGEKGHEEHRPAKP